MFIVTYFIAVCFKKNWCRLPENGEIIAAKHIGARYEICTYKLQTSAFVPVT
jgi:hypothetical protein